MLRLWVCELIVDSRSRWFGRFRESAGADWRGGCDAGRGIGAVGRRFFCLLFLGLCFACGPAEARAQETETAAALGSGIAELAKEASKVQPFLQGKWTMQWAEQAGKLEPVRPHRIMLGLQVTGVDVDELLPVMYEKCAGPCCSGSVLLLNGRFPAEDSSCRKRVRDMTCSSRKTH